MGQMYASILHCFSGETHRVTANIQEQQQALDCLLHKADEQKLRLQDVFPDMEDARHFLAEGEADTEVSQAGEIIVKRMKELQERLRQALELKSQS